MEVKKEYVYYAIDFNELFTTETAPPKNRSKYDLYYASFEDKKTGKPIAKLGIIFFVGVL